MAKIPPELICAPASKKKPLVPMLISYIYQLANHCICPSDPNKGLSYCLLDTYDWTNRNKQGISES